MQIGTRFGKKDWKVMDKEVLTYHRRQSGWAFIANLVFYQILTMLPGRLGKFSLKGSMP